MERLWCSTALDQTKQPAPCGARTKAARNHRRATARWWAGRLVGTRVSRRVERALTRPSLPLNDENCFVVNLILLSNLPQTVIFFCGVFQHRSADVSR